MTSDKLPNKSSFKILFKINNLSINKCINYTTNLNKLNVYSVYKAVYHGRDVWMNLLWIA